MLSDSEIAALAAAGESDRVEFKRNAQEPTKIRRTACAYANDLAGHGAPGVILVGIEDDGACAGIAVDSELLDRLAQLRGDGAIQPLPSLAVRALTVRGCAVAAVIVKPASNTPVRTDRRAWVTVGATTLAAPPEDERRLTEKRRWGNLPFDGQGVPGATLANIDLERFRVEYLPSAVSPEVLAENRRTPDEQLRALRLVRPDGTPTVTAILVLGKSPRDWLPGAYVQFLRLAGTALSDPIVDQKELGGTVGDQLRQLDELLGLHIARAIAVGGPRAQVQPDYPETALRQLVRNALLHRNYEGTASPVRITWYSDRVEILSPGGPYGLVTRENFGSPGITDYRNPTLAEALYNLRFVERFGRGIEIARAALRNNGNPDPIFTVEPTHVHVTVSRRP